MTISLIYEEIFSYCSPRELLRLSRVCRNARVAVQDYMRRVFDVDRRLRYFFADATAFRSLQARTGTLISGSFALRFFERSDVPFGLDLLVHPQHRHEVGRWLIKAGYDFKPAPHQDREFESTIFKITSVGARDLHALDGIASRLQFQRPLLGSSDKAPRFVQMVVAESTPMEVVLSSHSSTLLVYWIIMTYFNQ